MAQSAISQHLRILKEAGLVRSLKRGNWMHYEMSAEGLESCGRALAEVFGLEARPNKTAGGTRSCPPSLLKECHGKAPAGKTKIGRES